MHQNYICILQARQNGFSSDQTYMQFDWFLSVLENHEIYYIGAAE